MTPHWRECEAPLRRTQRDGADETVLCRSQAPLGNASREALLRIPVPAIAPGTNTAPAARRTCLPIGIPGEFFHTLSRGVTAPNDRSRGRPAQRIKTPKTPNPLVQSLPWSTPRSRNHPQNKRNTPHHRHSGIFIPLRGMKISGISRASGPERPPLSQQLSGIPNNASHKTKKNKKRINPRLPRRRAGSRRSSGVTAPNDRSRGRPAQRIKIPKTLTPRAVTPVAACVSDHSRGQTLAPATALKQTQQHRSIKPVSFPSSAWECVPRSSASHSRSRNNSQGNTTAPPQNQKPLVLPVHRRYAVCGRSASSPLYGNKLRFMGASPCSRSPTSRPLRSASPKQCDCCHPIE